MHLLVSRMPPVLVSNSEYMRRLLPRPITFHLARKRENAFNMGQNSTSSSEDADSTRVNPRESLCRYETVRKVADWKKPSRAGAGLHNLGNTCYLNSVIQCLTHTAPLAGLCLNGYFSRRIKASNESSLNIFVCHVQRALSKHGGGAFAPKSIIRKLRTYSRTFRVGRQEDAHEFLRTFLGSLQKSCLRASGRSSDDVSPVAETTSIYHVFGGYMESQVKCLQCKNTSKRSDVCLDVSIEVSRTLQSALKRHTAIELLDKDNRWRCDKCKQLVRATKQLLFKNLPTILVVHLKRFSPFGGKLMSHVEYSPRLNMKQYSSRSCGEEDFNYDLYAVLVHSGHSTHSGHYYSYVKAPNGGWYEMNDSYVGQVGLKTVLRQQAYLLFYKKSVLKSSSSDNAAENHLHPKDSMKSRPSAPVQQCEEYGEEVLRPKSKPESPELPSNRTKESMYDESRKCYSSSGIRSIMKGVFGTPALRRFIMNKRALQGAKPPSPPPQPTIKNERPRSATTAVRHNKSKQRVVKFQQGEETVMIHGYSDGKLIESSSVKGWKASLENQKKQRNRLYRPLPDPSKATGSWEGSANQSQVALYSAMQKMHTKEDRELKRSRRPDEWDSLYDQGRQKKVKAPQQEFDAPKKNMSKLFDQAYKRKKKFSQTGR